MKSTELVEAVVAEQEVLIGDANLGRQLLHNRQRTHRQ
jgi:hypothetical protein